MTVVGVSMVLDEVDVIEGTVRHMAAEVDTILIADNGSTDGTRAVLDALARELPLTVIDDPEPGYYQSAKMSGLAARAAADGATWIVPFDADELWTAEHRIGDVLPRVAASIVRAPLTNHFRTAIDVDDPDPYRSMVWRQRDAAPFSKVAFRWEPGAVIHQGNHGVTLPLVTGVAGDMPVTVGLQVRHFPYRSAEQMIRKARNGAAAYAATNLNPVEGAHWRAYGAILDRLGEDGLREVFNTHFCYLSPTDSGLVRDPAPYLRWLDPPIVEPA